MPVGPRPAPPARTLRLVASWSYSVANGINVFHLRLGGTNPVTVADLTTWLDSAAVTAAFTRLYLHSSALLVVYKLSAVFEGSGGPIESAVDASIAGGGAIVNVSEAHDAAVIQWHVARAYRGGHPRTYIGGLTADEEGTVRSLSTAYQGQLGADAASFRSQLNATAIGGSDFELGQVSFSEHNAWRSPPIFEPFERDPTVQRRLCTQRRRLGRAFR